MAHELVLPLSVVGPADVMRLRRSLEQFDNQQQQAALRAKAGTKAEVGAAGATLLELAAANKRDLAAATDRRELLTDLESVLQTAPTITMSFASEPSAAFMTKITSWFRSSIHPSLLIRTGLQPAIAAGCTIRTGGKVYDFSLRHKFSEQRSVLIERLRNVPAPTQPAITAPVAAPPQPPVGAAT